MGCIGLNSGFKFRIRLQGQNGAYQDIYQTVHLHDSPCHLNKPFVTSGRNIYIMTGKVQDANSVLPIVFSLVSWLTYLS